MATEKILPKDGQRNILITSALPYVNNVPHLGNIIGSVLSADVFSRYNKARGRPTLYVCGTDEYGTATETKALEEGVTPEELCAKYNKIHAEVYEWFEIAFDIFGRTPTKQHTEISQHIFLKLKEKGYLEEKTSKQPFCEAPAHQKFLADRFVEGTCPVPGCGYEDARGDQCDKCGNLLDPFDLINPRCKLDGTAPVPRDTTHTYLLLDKLQPDIEKFTEESIRKGGWSRNAKIITESWLKEGLKDRGITRDLSWGVPVPLPGYENKVLYVWFEACIGYPSITANYTTEWEKWWRDPENVQLYQFLGKDNVPFHSVIFPGCQIATGERWTKVHHLAATEYLNYENGKFSKSRGIGVFGNNAKDTGVPPDVWRYYLLKNRPESGDTQFEWRNFIDGNNSELLAKLGNFVNRVVKLVNSPKAYNGVIPDQFNPSTLPESFTPSLKEITSLLLQYLSEMETVHLRAALATAMRIAEAGNGLIQSHRLDNSLIASQPDLAAQVVGTVINLIYLCSAVFEPYLPATCRSIRDQVNAPYLFLPNESDLEPSGWRPTYLKAGHKIGKAAYLFTKIDEKKADEWRDMYGGKQADRVAKEKAQNEANAAASTASKKAGAGKKDKPAKAKTAEEIEQENARVAKIKADKKAAKLEKRAKAQATPAAGKDGGRSGGGATGVEATAKGDEVDELEKGAKDGVVDKGEDAAVDKVVDGVKQVSIPTS